MKKDLPHYHELKALRFILFWMVVVVFLFLFLGCSSVDKETKRACKVQCEDCKNLKFDCSHENEREGKKVTPVGS